MSDMAVVEFVCPHCSGPFELENPPLGERVACPQCGGMLEIPAELPGDDADEDEARATDDSESQPTAFDIGELAPAEMLPHHRSTVHHERPIRQLSREEKQRRRQIRSLVWMIGGGVLLAIAVAVLSRL